MKKADFIIIAAVLAVAAVMLVFLYGSDSNTGAYVQIQIDGEIVQTLPLDEDTQYEIKTENGTNTLTISDGSAKMTQADCPDGICKNHKAIDRDGESIICLPHKVVVTVINSSDSNAPDVAA